jgi:hypothetical protein
VQRTSAEDGQRGDDRHWFMKTERSIGIEDPGETSARGSRPICPSCRPPAPLKFDYGTVLWYCECCGLVLDEGE